MRRTRAFTLVELMAVLVIAGTLAFVASSSWPSYWQRTRRAAAGAALVATLAQLELRHARTGTYDGGGPIPTPQVDGYEIRFNVGCTSLDIGSQSSDCVEVVAVADPPNDAACGYLRLLSTGEREPHNAACWP
nr:prepilin-type N-terminal cleavage/methylation domain-containing protein [uncultured Ralstonia sp.]